MGKSSVRWGIYLLPASALCVGCADPSLVTPQRLESGYVMVLPGVENYASTATGIVTGLRDAGVPYAVQVNGWGQRPFGTFPNLMHYEINRRRAVAVADVLVRYRRSHPDAPVILLGYSGGAGMALFVAEALPPEIKLDRMVLLCAAISPKYDLTAALSHCKRGIVTFYSEGDWFMLGWGTQLFGTMDRVNTDAAGRCGFLSPDGQLLQKEGLRQIAWRPEWRRLGNWGGHPGWFAQAWAREVLAPEVDPNVKPKGQP